MIVALINTDQILHNFRRETDNISRQVLHRMSRNIFRRCETFPTARRRQFELQYFHEITWTAEDAGFECDYAPPTDAELREQISGMLVSFPIDFLAILRIQHG
jgi:hypothetical protein